MGTIHVKKAVPPPAAICCSGKGDDWQKVSVRVIESKSVPDTFQIIGEGMVKVHKKIKSLSDLSDMELIEIKKAACNNKCCVLYVDIKGIYDNPAFPKENTLYYYWGNEKKD